MSHVRRFDHVGLTVADLDVVTAFFVALGLEVEGRTFVEGEFLDTVCGIPDSRTEIVMLKPPDDGTRLELSSFVRPDSVPGSPAAMANELGLRNVAFEVNDLQAAVDWAATEGYGLVGGIGEYEGAWRMAYVRGPEGIIVCWPSASAEPRNVRRCRRSQRVIATLHDLRLRAEGWGGGRWCGRRCRRRRWMRSGGGGGPGRR
jgi:catechol 2,3-dioxygenase-like lactoylglutathione lyase family enzyme